MIKRIACLSTIKNTSAAQSYPEQVFSIYDAARVFNRDNDITGIFLVSGTVLLQVLEGQSDKLANAIYRASRDPRVLDVSVVVNEIIERPAFKRWTLKLTSENNEDHAQYVANLKKLIEPSLRGCTGEDRRRLESIFELSSQTETASARAPDTHPSNPQFGGKSLSMKSWPRPTQLRLNAPLMKLCPLLIGRTVAYDRLVELNPLGSEDELYQLMCLLYRVGALQVSDSPVAAAVSDIELKREARHVAQGGSRFSQALRNFIHNHKAKGV